MFGWSSQTIGSSSTGIVSDLWSLRKELIDSLWSTILRVFVYWNIAFKERGRQKTRSETKREEFGFSGQGCKDVWCRSELKLHWQPLIIIFGLSFDFQILNYVGNIYWEWCTIKCDTSRRYPFSISGNFTLCSIGSYVLVLTFFDDHFLMIIYLRCPFFWQGNTNDWNLWFGSCVDPQGKKCRFRTLCCLGQARKRFVF